MNRIIDLKINKNRGIVMETIRRDLYTEEEFPKKLFPDLTAVLFGCFTEIIKTNANLREAYNNPDAKQELENLTRKALEFRNLLAHYPQTVVLMYHTYIKKFIRYKHRSSNYSMDEWEDIFQEVITRLISGKIQRIRDRFDFSYQNENFPKKSFFTSYLMVTVRNIYMDIIRERNVRTLTAGHVQPLDDVLENYKLKDNDVLNQLMIAREFQKFRMLLGLYHKSRPKLELCLKLKSRIPLNETDIKHCFPGCQPADIQLLAQNFKGIKDKKLFDTVILAFNRSEGTENKSDTLRKWVSVKVDEIASHLNQSHSSNVYNNKNLVDFITLYYEWLGSNGPKLKPDRANHGGSSAG